MLQPLNDIELLLPRLEEVIWQVARESMGPVRQRELVQAVQELSKRYNRPEAGPVHLGDTLPIRQARLLFFTLADLPKAALPLAELEAAGRLPRPEGPLRVLDLGAGHGALSLGLLAYRAARGVWPGPVELDAVDWDRDALAGLARIAAEATRQGVLPPGARLQVKGTDLSRPPQLDGGYHLILAGTLLNELPDRCDEDLVRAALEALAPDGVLVLMEPALRHTARRLHRLRDRLLAEGAATLLAPCTHAKPCPMLASERDWCHERRPWQPPPHLRHLTSATALRRRDLRFAYLTLARPGAAPLERQAGAWRVVSDSLGGKGRLELFACGAEGRHRVVLLKRHRGGDNSAFSRLARGHLVWLDGVKEAGDGLRLDTESRVEGLDPVESGE